MAAAVYVLLNLVLLYYAFLVNSAAMIIFSMVMGALFVLFFFTGLVSSKKTSVSLFTEKGKLHMTIKKNGILPLTSLKFTLSFVYDQSGEGQEVKGKLCFPRGESEAVYPLTIPYAGSGMIKVDRMKVSDPIGLFRFRVKNSADVPINIFPVFEGEMRYVSGDRRLSSDSDYAQTEDVPGNDPSETLQVHEYIPGDKLNRIHYKLSAKKSTMLVRDFGAESTEYYLFILNFNKNSQESFHRIVTNLYSIGTSLVMEGAAFTVLWADHKERLYEEQASSLKDLTDIILYIYRSMKAPLKSRLSADFILSEYQATHPYVRNDHGFVVTDEAFDELIGRWQHEA